MYCIGRPNICIVKDTDMSEKLELPRIIPMLIGYSEDFRNATGSGWGCGYALIPESHPAYDRIIEVDDYEYGNYDNCSELHDVVWNGIQQEITLDVDIDISGKKYRKVGFDTAHIYNNMENSNFSFVNETTLKMVDLIERYYEGRVSNCSQLL
jgi:hypothetical protein